MEDVDYPRAWLRFKAYIGQERGHGADDLLAEMSRIEVECSEAHRDAQMARGKRSTPPDGPPRDRAASASRTRAPRSDKPTTPEGARNGNGHRDQRREAAPVG